MLDTSDIEFIGHGLFRPECALAHSSGLMFIPDWTDDGGVSVIFPDGSVKRHLAKNWRQVAQRHQFDEPLRPNGICLLENGAFLLAHLGSEKGGIFQLLPNGEVQAFLLEVEGQKLPPCNFVTRDVKGRVWITVSTRQTPRDRAYRFDVADGFIALMDEGETRIVADHLGYTNECLLHPDGERLFVNETFARKLTSFKVAADGSLSDRKTVAQFGPGTFPDGLAFDENGDAWITSIVSNRVIRVDETGATHIFVEDADLQHLDWVEQAWLSHEMGRPHLDKAAGRDLRNISNLAFAGKNLDKAVLGCLLGERLATFEAPTKGAAPTHWTFDIEELIKALQNTPPVLELHHE